MVATILIPVMLLSGTGTGIQSRDEQVLRQYRVAVDTYAALHREAVAALPDPVMCGGPESLELTRDELADELRRLRPNAREGAIFTSEVAALLRRRLEAVRNAEAPDDEAEIPYDRPTRWIVRVNEGYPPYPGTPRSLALFRALPSLPEELEYRLFGRDLVLVDVTVNIVVDVLRDALRGV